MALPDCIRRALDAGEMTQEFADAITKEYNKVFNDFAGRYGRSRAEYMAGERVIKVWTFEMRQRAKLKILQTRAIRHAVDSVRDYRTLHGRVNDREGALGLIESQGLPTKFASVEVQRRALVDHATSLMAELLQEQKQDLAQTAARTGQYAINRLSGGAIDAPGLGRSRALQAQIIQELGGQASGNPHAARLADAWRQTVAYLLREHNRVAGAVAALLDYIMPQFHDAHSMVRAGEEAWSAWIMDRLDWNRMLDRITGQPIEPARRQQVLSEIYRTITTRGFNAIEEYSTSFGNASIGRRRMNQHRFLHFKTGQDWYDYQQAFGSPDTWATMMAHIQSMARDIAAMDVLGPNPALTLEAVKIDIRRRNSGEDGGIGQALDDLWAQYSGAAHQAVNPQFAAIMAGTRNMMTAARLGGAALSATGDVLFATLTAKKNTMPALSMLREYAALLNPANPADRRAAAELGVTVEGWTQDAAAASRYNLDVMTPALTRRISDTVLRASGLTAMTDSMRQAFQVTWMRELALNQATAWDDLDAGFREQAIRYGLTAADWTWVQRAPTRQWRGRPVLSPMDMDRTLLSDAAARREIMGRLYNWMYGEMRFAVIDANMRDRALILSRAKPGTIGGEFLRSGLMFKSFPLAMVHTHMRRAVEDMARDGVWNRVQYAAALFTGALLMGALVTWLKDIAAGKDPRPIDEKFFIQAIAQSGAASIYGDFLLADQNKFGQSPFATLLGPPIGFAEDVAKITVGNVQEMLQGKDTNAAREIARMAGYVPGSNLWYLGVIYQRYVVENLENAMAPTDHKRRIAKRMKDWQDKTGGEYWWPLGEASPERAPRAPALREDFGR